MHKKMIVSDNGITLGKEFLDKAGFAEGAQINVQSSFGRLIISKPTIIHQVNPNALPAEPATRGRSKLFKA